MTADEAKSRIDQEMAQLAPSERDAIVNALAAQGMFAPATKWLCACEDPVAQSAPRDGARAPA